MSAFDPLDAPVNPMWAAGRNVATAAADTVTAVADVPMAAIDAITGKKRRVRRAEGLTAEAQRAARAYAAAAARAEKAAGRATEAAGKAAKLARTLRGEVDVEVGIVMRGSRVVGVAARTTGSASVPRLATQARAAFVRTAAAATAGAGAIDDVRAARGGTKAPKKDAKKAPKKDTKKAPKKDAKKAPKKDAKKAPKKDATRGRGKPDPIPTEVVTRDREAARKAKKRKPSGAAAGGGSPIGAPKKIETARGTRYQQRYQRPDGSEYVRWVKAPF